MTVVQLDTLATITVTFNPDLELLTSQLHALPDNCLKIIVDNASEPNKVAEIELLVLQFANIELLRNGKNIGLAAAINCGAHLAAQRSSRPRFLLLLDQDSEPQPFSIEKMLDAFATLESNDERVGCVGPLLLDPDTGLTHGFHQHDRFRWKRVYPRANAINPIPCANLNGSGTLVPLSLFLELGGLDELFFIDHVDTEWAFRMLSAGYSLWGVPNAVFSHRMGQDCARFWFFGWRLWPVRSPNRHYFLFRNAITLMRRSYVPKVWKFWAVLKLLLTVGVVVGTHPKRIQQLLYMGRGVCTGFKHREKRKCRNN